MCVAVVICLMCNLIHFLSDGERGKHKEGRSVVSFHWGCVDETHALFQIHVLTSLFILYQTRENMFIMLVSDLLSLCVCMCMSTMYVCVQEFVCMFVILFCSRKKSSFVFILTLKGYYRC